MVSTEPRVVLLSFHPCIRQSPDASSTAYYSTLRKPVLIIVSVSGDRMLSSISTREFLSKKLIIEINSLIIQNYTNIKETVGHSMAKAFGCMIKKKLNLLLLSSVHPTSVCVANDLNLRYSISHFKSKSIEII